ncbi:MAG: hypothetical protein ACFBZ9_10330 [Sphingomonadales bacterium]
MALDFGYPSFANIGSYVLLMAFQSERVFQYLPNSSAAKYTGSAL